MFVKEHKDSVIYDKYLEEARSLARYWKSKCKQLQKEILEKDKQIDLMTKRLNGHSIEVEKGSTYWNLNRSTEYKIIVKGEEWCVAWEIGSSNYEAVDIHGYDSSGKPFLEVL